MQRSRLAGAHVAVDSDDSEDEAEFSDGGASEWGAGEVEVSPEDEQALAAFMVRCQPLLMRICSVVLQPTLMACSGVLGFDLKFGCKVTLNTGSACCCVSSGRAHSQACVFLGTVLSGFCCNFGCELVFHNMLQAPNAGSYQQQTLADIIMNKIRQKQSGVEAGTSE